MTNNPHCPNFSHFRDKLLSAFLLPLFLLKMPLKADNIHVLFDTIPFLL